MNELLKELLPNPYMVDYQVPHDGRGFDLYDERKMIEYGQRIVRECARVARATPSPNFHEHLKQQLGHTWDMAANEAGREIVKHFGVEE
jgi:hypothetical protein